MTQVQRVGISEYRVAAAPGVLTSHGFGSCVGVVLYDSQVRLGGLAHTLLPEPRAGMAITRPGKFVPLAVRAMLDELVALGADRQRIEARICGGAHMFQPPPEDLSRTVGARNVAAAREILLELGIKLVSEDVGGSFGRTLEFDLATGKVLLRFVRGHDKVREL